MTQDKRKTKAQLIDELVELRKRLADPNLASQDLLDSELRFRNMYEQSPIGIEIYDRDGKLIDANPASLDIFGVLSVDDVRGFRLFEDPNLPEGALDRLQSGDSVQFTSSFDFEIVKKMALYDTQKSGECFVDVQITPFDMSGTEDGGFLVFVRDITERTRAELALRDSKSRYQAVSELTSDYAYCFRVEPNDDLVNEWVTGALDRLTGFTREELQASGGWERLIQADDQSIPMGQLEAVLSNQAKTVEYRIVTKDGQVRWMLDHARPIWDSEERRVTCIEGAVRDITDLKQAEQDRLDLQLRVQHAQKLESLETLAGGIAHDFNNLLMGVLGNAELALANIPPSSPARGDIESARQAATRAAELANQMLAYSGRGHFVTETINLSEVTASMGHLFEASLPKTTILNYQLDEQIPPIEGDKAQIRQVVLAFVTNASEAIENQQGIVEITTGTMECDRARLAEIDIANDCTEGTYAFLEVADEGVGMDAETLSNIFDPFFTTKFTGRGLGLAAVFGIVRGHRGGITIESELGKGTTIRALFPISEKPAGRSQTDDDYETALATAALGNVVLLVDDEPSVLEVGTRMLAMAGFQVRTARDGYEAIEVFKQHSDDIACVILDLTMPKMDGEKTFFEFQKIRDDVPVLLSSGYTAEDVEARISMRGFAGFIKKPYMMNQLMKHVRRALVAE